MTDEELLQKVEKLTIYSMLRGRAMDDWLSGRKTDIGSWVVNLRADEVSRLIDLARQSLPKECK